MQQKRKNHRGRRAYAGVYSMMKAIEAFELEYDDAPQLQTNRAGDLFVEAFPVEPWDEPFNHEPIPCWYWGRERHDASWWTDTRTEAPGMIVPRPAPRSPAHVWRHYFDVLEPPPAPAPRARVVSGPPPAPRHALSVVRAEPSDEDRAGVVFVRDGIEFKVPSRMSAAEALRLAWEEDLLAT